MPEGLREFYGHHSPDKNLWALKVPKISMRGVVDDVRTCFETATARFSIPSLSLKGVEIN